MAILTGPLMSVNDTGKVPSRKVAKSQIVLLILLLINNVGRTLFIRIATKTKWPPRWIYYASNAYISVKTWTLALTKAYLWSTSDSKTYWTVNRRHQHRLGTEPESGKIANCSYSSYSYSYSYSYSSRKNLYSIITQSY